LLQRLEDSFSKTLDEHRQFYGGSVEAVDGDAASMAGGGKPGDTSSAKIYKL